MAGFGKNDEVVTPSAKPFGANDEVVSHPVSPVNHHMKGTLTGRETPPRSTATQIADLMEGTAKVAAPAAAAAFPFAPATAIGAGVGGYLAGKGGSMAADALGASPDVSRLTGDITAIPGAAFGGRFAPPVARAGGMFLNAATDPEVLNTIPGASHVNAAKTAFGNAYRRAGATTIPDVPMSVANDPRPLNGPVAPPPAVLRDAQSPAWASHPDPSAPLIAPFQSIPSEFPSGRIIGSPEWGEAVTRYANNPVVSERAPRWSGISDSPDLIPEPLTVPSNVSLPSGRVPGGIRNQRVAAAPPETALPSPPAVATPAPGPNGSTADHSSITSQYKPSRTRARFDASGKRVGG